MVVQVALESVPREELAHLIVVAEKLQSAAGEGDRDLVEGDVQAQAIGVDLMVLVEVRVGHGIADPDIEPAVGGQHAAEGMVAPGMHAQDGLSARVQMDDDIVVAMEDRHPGIVPLRAETIKAPTTA